MIRTFLEFEVLDGQADALVEFFQQHRILSTAAEQDGCLGAELTVAADGETAIVTALWRDTESYDRWTSRSDRADLAEYLGRLVRLEDGPATVGGLYRVALSAG